MDGRMDNSKHGVRRGEKRPFRRRIGLFRLRRPPLGIRPHPSGLQRHAQHRLPPRSESSPPPRSSAVHRQERHLRLLDVVPPRKRRRRRRRSAELRPPRRILSDRADDRKFRFPPHTSRSRLPERVGHVLPRSVDGAADSHVGPSDDSAATGVGSIPGHGGRVSEGRDRRVSLSRISSDGGGAHVHRRRIGRGGGGRRLGGGQENARRAGSQGRVGGDGPRPLRGRRDAMGRRIFPLHGPVVRVGDSFPGRMDGGFGMRRRPSGDRTERRAGESDGVGVRAGIGASGHGPVRRAGHSIVLDRGRTVPRAVSGEGDRRDVRAVFQVSRLLQGHFVLDVVRVLLLLGGGRWRFFGGRRLDGIDDDECVPRE
mmetsp:Transcript_36115/g.108069  ORF Transcript_36115/g.108069 Transcript_36115/m.108069 type:complete len:369 (-) Transcript_36115:446-1552(-)